MNLRGENIVGAGNINQLFELSFPDEATAKLALNKAIQKLPIACKIITREEPI